MTHPPYLGHWKRGTDRKSRLLLARDLVRGIDRRYGSRKIVMVEFDDYLMVYPAAEWPVRQEDIWERYEAAEAKRIIRGAKEAVVQENGRFQLKHEDYRWGEGRENRMVIFGRPSAIRIELDTGEGKQMEFGFDDKEADSVEEAPEEEEAAQRGRGRPVNPGHIVDLRLADIHWPDERYAMREKLDVEDLVDSLAKEGQRFAIYVRGPKPYRVIAGARRVEAMRQMKKEKIKAIVFPRMSEDEAQRLALIDNLEHTGLSDADLILAVGKLRERGMRSEEIAGLLRRKVRTVQRLLKLSKAPKRLLSEIRRGRLTVSAAYEVYANGIDIEEALSAPPGRGGRSVREIQRLGREHEHGRAAIRRLADGGFRLSLDFRKDGGEEQRREMVRVLSEALEEVWSSR